MVARGASWNYTSSRWCRKHHFPWWTSIQSQTNCILRPSLNTVRFAHLPTLGPRPNPRHMDFLKSAVASAISQGPPFPYTFGDKVDVDESIWTLYNGTRRVSLPADNWPCSARAYHCGFRRMDRTAASSHSTSRQRRASCRLQRTR